MSPSSPSSTATPLDAIAAAVPGLDLWQPRDWPHRRGDRLDLSLHSMPLPADSPGRRSHPCEHCGGPALCIHDNVLCWRCKGTFCLTCYVPDPSVLMRTPVDSIVKNGFGKCKVCEEPLRSIALVDLFRTVLETASGGPSSGPLPLGGGVVGVGLPRDNPRASSPGGIPSSHNESLVLEAEEAVARADRHAERNETEAAILECTHAINAINYLASASGGRHLVLRAHDLLLLAHFQRAELEGGDDLASALAAAYPKASVMDPKENEKSYRLSTTAFRALFYPLPTKFMAGSEEHRPQFVVFDLRQDSRREAVESDFFRQQVQLVGATWESATAFSAQQPNLEGTDAKFERLNGTWKGIYSHMHLERTPPSCIMVGGKELRMMQMHQFVHVFPTARQAGDYTRLRTEQGEIGEEKWSRHSPTISKALKKRTQELGAQMVRKIHVLSGSLPVPVSNSSFSAVAAVDNVSTKVFVAVVGEGDGMEIVARALAHLERQLVSNRSEKGPSPLKQAFQHPDLTMCAYCGNCPAKLLTCTRCKLARYCGVDCQKKHWNMKGPFGHKCPCKAVAKATTSG